MTFCCTPGSAPCPAIVRAVSSCSSREQDREPQLCNLQGLTEGETLKYSVLKGWQLQVSPLRAGTIRIGGRKSVRPERMEDTKGTRPLKHSRISTQGLTETMAAAQGLLWPAPQVLPVPREVDTRSLPSLTQKLPPIDNHLQMRSLFSSMKSQCGCKPNNSFP